MIVQCNDTADQLFASPPDVQIDPPRRPPISIGPTQLKMLHPPTRPSTRDVALRRARTSL